MFAVVCYTLDRENGPQSKQTDYQRMAQEGHVARTARSCRVSLLRVDSKSCIVAVCPLASCERIPLECSISSITNVSNSIIIIISIITIMLIISCVTIMIIELLRGVLLRRRGADAEAEVHIVAHCLLQLVGASGCFI